MEPTSTKNRFVSDIICKSIFLRLTTITIVSQVESECVEKRGSGKDLTGEFRMALPIVLGYVLPEGAPPWCALYARSEPNFAKQLRDHQVSEKGEE